MLAGLAFTKNTSSPPFSPLFGGFPSTSDGWVPQGDPEGDPEVVKVATGWKGHLVFFLHFVEQNLDKWLKSSTRYWLTKEAVTFRFRWSRPL